MRKTKRTKEKKNRWNLMFGISLTALCAALAFTAWTVAGSSRGGPDPFTDPADFMTGPPSVLESDVYVEANWAPAPRLPGLNAAMLSQLDAAAAQALVERGFRSVVLPALESFTQADVDRAKEVLDTLGDQGVFRTLTIPPVDSQTLPDALKALSDLIAGASFDALLLPDISQLDAGGDILTVFTDKVTQLLDAAGLDLPVIFELGSAGQGAAGYLEAVRDLANGLQNSEVLVFIEDAAQKFFKNLAKQLAGGSNDAADGCPLLTALFDVKKCIPNGTLEETFQFFDTLQALGGIPLTLLGADYAPKDSQALELLRQFFAGDLDLGSLSRGLSLGQSGQRILTLKPGQTVYTNKPVITFVGASSPLHPLTCDGKDVARNESGDFSVDMPLEPGRNTFRFEHRGEIFEIHVVYEVKVLESVSPTGTIETTGGIELAVSAVALRGATVLASLDGKTITLQPGAQPGAAEDGAGILDEDSAYITYVGAFTLPDSGAAQRSLGSLFFSAAYQGLRDTMGGARVTLLPEIAPPPEQPPPDTTTTTTATETTTTTAAPPPSSEESTFSSTASSPPPPSQESSEESGSSTETESESSSSSTSSSASSAPKALLTPDTNHGLGTAKMVEITADYASARWNGTTETTPVPTVSPLLKGTYDYITGQQIQNGTTYYELSSGKRMKAADLRVINSGYRLPSNAVQVSSVSNNGALDLRFAMTWKAPFNVSLIGQTYVRSNGYDWGVGMSGFNATGLEITFSHTGSGGGSVDFGSYPLLASHSITTNAAANTVTLKLMFKNPGKFYGYKAFYDGDQLVIRLKRRPPASLAGAVIFLDPGHGGTDPGAPYVASHDTLKHEKFVNILIALKLRAKLEAAGATVYMTRTGDTTHTLAERTAMLRAKNPDLFISMHTDSTETAAPSGTTAFYYRAYSQPLALAVHRRVVEAYLNKIYVAGSGISNYADMRTRVDRGVKYYPFEVTRVEECPAMLIEYGFGSNLTECRVLQKDVYHEIFAQATFDGICDYLKTAQ